jgi:leader peptidase (prepilin peptidase)/N-methyltransferase
MIIEAILPAILLGAIAGSFLSTVAQRWHDLPSLAGRSRCDRCGVPIPAHANVPILGFVLLRGRCGRCGGAIDPAHIVMEAGCAAIGGIALAIEPTTEGWIAAGFGWTLALLALIDAREQRLPDAIVLPLGAAGLALGAVHLPPPFETRAVGALAGFVALWLVAAGYRVLRGREGLGRGDAKLLGAIGAWTGWVMLPQIVLVAALLGLAWAGFRFARGHRVEATDRLPFGTLLALAAWPLSMAAAAGLSLPLGPG